MDVVRALWHGDIPLAKTYWLYGFLGNFLLSIPLIILGEYPLPPSSLSTAFVVTYTLFTFVYGLLMCVAIWRSASKYTGYYAWAGLAKLAVILGVVRMMDNFRQFIGGIEEALKQG